MEKFAILRGNWSIVSLYRQIFIFYHYYLSDLGNVMKSLNDLTQYKYSYCWFWNWFKSFTLCSASSLGVLIKNKRQLKELACRMKGCLRSSAAFTRCVGSRTSIQSRKPCSLGETCLWTLVAAYHGYWWTKININSTEI